MRKRYNTKMQRLAEAGESHREPEKQADRTRASRATSARPALFKCTRDTSTRGGRRCGQHVPH